MLRLLIQMRNYAVLAFLLMTLIVCQISVQASENNKQNTSSYFQSYQLKKIKALKSLHHWGSYL